MSGGGLRFTVPLAVAVRHHPPTDGDYAAVARAWATACGASVIEVDEDLFRFRLVHDGTGDSPLLARAVRAALDAGARRVEVESGGLRQVFFSAQALSEPVAAGPARLVVHFRLAALLRHCR